MGYGVEWIKEGIDHWNFLIACKRERKDLLEGEAREERKWRWIKWHWVKDERHLIWVRDLYIVKCGAVEARRKTKANQH